MELGIPKLQSQLLKLAREEFVVGQVKNKKNNWKTKVEWGP